MIEINNLCKKYNNVVALNNVSISIQKKSIVVVAGTNGSGKTTLFKCLTGLIPFSGKITIDGYSPNEIESKKKLAFCAEIPEIFDFLTLDEHLHYWGLALGINDWKTRANILYKQFKLEDYIHILGKNMSKGIKQKTALCCALIRDNGYFIFDEPFVGLDPYAIRELKKIILEKKNQGCTFIISTHILESVQDIWENMFIIDNGLIKKNISRKDFKNSENILDLFFDSQNRIST